MEETKNLELGSGQEQEEKSAIDLSIIHIFEDTQVWQQGQSGDT